VIALAAIRSGHDPLRHPDTIAQARARFGAQWWRVLLRQLRAMQACGDARYDPQQRRWTAGEKHARSQ